MAKYSGTATKPRRPQAPTATVGPTPTHEGGRGYEKDAKTALYTLAVVNMVKEATFYEAAEGRDDRFRNLVAQVTREEPVWVQSLVGWLRHRAHLRTAPLVIALEYAHAGGPNVRSTVSAALRRADEPAEALGYWLHRYGRKIPRGVKLGIADAAVRLYDERSVLKYDTVRSGVRMADVLELTHPRASSSEQNALFRHIIDRRHERTTPTAFDLMLQSLAAAHALDVLPEDARRPRLRERGPEELAKAGYTWERLSGWLPGGMDAEAWEAVIPSMGYMALIRNLRNFEKAKVSEALLKQVAEKIADPDEVARSRQLPYRFYSAYVNSGTTYFAYALERALAMSMQNLPIFPGRTLVMVDTSASMRAPVSERSQVRLCDIAALFGVAVASTSKVDLAIYAEGHRRLDRIPTSVLRGSEMIANCIGEVGHATRTWPSTLAEYHGHDRIVVFTDMQDHPADVRGLPDVPIYVWDLAGYATTNVDLLQPNRYLFGGFTDAAFRLISLLEAGQDSGWPWES